MTLVLVLITSLCFAKRSVQLAIQPIRKDGNEINFKISRTPCPDKNQLCGMQVSLTSKQMHTGKLNWERELYQKAFDPTLEADVQEVLPKSLTLKKSTELIVSDEKGSVYIIEAKTGEMLQPLKSIIYPGYK